MIAYIHAQLMSNFENTAHLYRTSEVINVTGRETY